VKAFLTLISVFIITAAALSADKADLSKGQAIYVPVYSHIYGGNKMLAIDLSVTLSIRNTDPANSITVSSADYYGTDGGLLKKYIDKPVKLPPLGTVRYIIRESDKTGGSGANFIVEWSSGKEVNEPLVESVMIGTKAQQGISFTSRGLVIKELQ
jgi:hypothetical protein